MWAALYRCIALHTDCTLGQIEKGKVIWSEIGFFFLIYSLFEGVRNFQNHGGKQHNR